MDKKKLAIGFGIAVAAVVGIYALARAAPPEEEIPPGLANLYGKVTDAETGGAIEGAEVTIDGLVTYTDASGRYAFEGLEPGTYAITFEKDGYEPATSDIILYEGNNELNVEMVPLALFAYVGDIGKLDAIVVTPEGELISNRHAYGVKWKVHNPTSSVRRLTTTMDVIYRYKYTWHDWADWSEMNAVEGICEARPPAYQPTKDRWVVTQVKYFEDVYGWQPYCDWVEKYAYPYGIGLICGYPFSVDVPPGETITIAIPIFLIAPSNYNYRVRLHSEAGEVESAEFTGRRHG